MKAYGGAEVQLSWPRLRMDVSGQLHAPATLPPGKSRTHWIGGRVGPQTFVDAV
jgi:hypothetical protein